MEKVASNPLIQALEAKGSMVVISGFVSQHAKERVRIYPSLDPSHYYEVDLKNIGYISDGENHRKPSEVFIDEDADITEVSKLKAKCLNEKLSSSKLCIADDCCDEHANLVYAHCRNSTNFGHTYCKDLADYHYHRCKNPGELRPPAPPIGPATTS